MAEPAVNWQWPTTWTEEDLRHLPQDGHRYEIFDGSLLVSPPAGESHQEVGGNLYVQLHTAAPAGWRVRYELGLNCDGRLMVADMVVLYPGAPRAEADYNDIRRIPVALVIEIESRSSALNDRNNKTAAYAEAGIPSYWRIERNGTIHVHEQATPGEPYKVVRTVRPGETWQADKPFPVLLDPSAIAADH